MTEASLIRALTRAEVETAVAWAAQEGWNPSEADADAFFAQDAGGFLGLFVEGSLAATLSAVRYAPAGEAGPFGFLGFYICRPDLRGRGLGFRLWQAGLARLEDCVIGLDGVLAQQANYARSGFVLAHRNIRFGGVPVPLPRIEPMQREAVAYTPALRAAVEACDLAHFGWPRPDFLARWLAPARGAVRVLLEGGVVTGYGVIRRCREGFKIGPLFASCPGGATALFTALVDEAWGAPIFLDVPEPNGAARVLAEQAGLSPVFETARMYRGPAPALPLTHIFGITSFELG